MTYQQTHSASKVSSLPVIVLDRDGIINDNKQDYVRTVEQFVFLPGSIDAIVKLTKYGYRIGIATNQSGVSRGYYSEETLHQIHYKMLTEIEQAGGRIDEITYCPHLPRTGCVCRKPNPGMLLNLAGKFQCALRDIIFIGDRITDLQAAYNAGTQAMLVLSNSTDDETRSCYPEVPVFDSLAMCVDNLIHHQGN